MASFKKTETIQGKWKSLQCTDEGIIDTETGEIVDIHAILLKQYGTDTEFSLAASYKSDVELD